MVLPASAVMFSSLQAFQVGCKQTLYIAQKKKKKNPGFVDFLSNPVSTFLMLVY
jgi:hypothetical protein